MREHTQLATVDLAREFRHQAQNPPGGKTSLIDKEVTGSFWEAMYDAAQDGPIAENIAEVTQIQVQKNPDTTAPLICGVIRTAYRAYLEASDPNFDIQSMTSKDSWQQPLGSIALALSQLKTGEGNEHADALQANLWTRNVQTNIVGRYTPAELLLQVIRDRAPRRGIDALDVGTSIMLGPLSMTNNVARRRLRFQRVLNTDAEYHETTDHASELLERPSTIRTYTGVDVYPSYNERRQTWDNGILEWASASTRPSEASNKTIAQLTRNKSCVTPFNQVDLSDPDDFLTFQRETDGKKYGFISWIASAHQLPPAKRGALYANLSLLLEDNGLLYIGEFASLAQRRRVNHKTQDITNLTMLSQWHRPGAFKGFVEDKSADRGLEHAFTFDDSRCRLMSYGAAQIAVHGSVMPLYQAVEEVATRH